MENQYNPVTETMRETARHQRQEYYLSEITHVRFDVPKKEWEAAQVFFRSRGLRVEEALEKFMVWAVEQEKLPWLEEDQNKGGKLK